MTMAAEWGYMGLFVVSFLAATLLPLSPEVLILLMQQEGYAALLLIIVATLAGYLGSLTNYYLARQGSSWLFRRYLAIPEARLARYRRAYERWGAVLLFFSWLPILGEPLLLVSGVLQVKLLIFSFWVIAGRLLRFSALLLLAEPLMG